MSTTLPFTSPAAAKRITDPSRAASRKAEHIGQDRRRLLRAFEEQRHAMQAADRMFGGDVLVAPTRLILGIGDADERERHPILIRKRQHGLTEALLQRLVGNSLLDEALSPVAD